MGFFQFSRLLDFLGIENNEQLVKGLIMRYSNSGSINRGHFKMI